MNHKRKRIWPTLAERMKPTGNRPTGVGAGAGTAVITPVEFIDSVGNTITGTAGSYINDELYDYLYNGMPNGTGDLSWRIWTASTNEEKTFDAAMEKMIEIAGEDTFLKISNQFIDLATIEAQPNYGAKFVEELNRWFGDTIIDTAASYPLAKYQFSKPVLPTGTGTARWGQLTGRENNSNFVKTDDYYNNMHPFNQGITYNSSSTMRYRFNVFPSTAWQKNSSGNVVFNIDGLKTKTINDATYIFIPWLVVYTARVSTPYTTYIEARTYAYTKDQYIAWLQSTSGQGAATYDWLTGGSDITYPGDEEVWIEPEYIGVLTDALTCTIDQEKNGVFDLTLTYPTGGKYATEIYNDRYIIADYLYGNANTNGRPYEYKKDRGYQVFKIYKIERSIDTLTAYAHHYSYAADGIIIEPFTITGTAQEALDALQEHAINNNDYIVLKEWIPDDGEPAGTIKTYTVNEYQTLRDCLYGKEGSLLQIFGGAFSYEDNHIWWSYGDNGYYQGNETGFKIEYGANMTEFDYNIDTDNNYDGIIGYAKDEENNHTYNGYYTTAEDLAHTKRLLTIDLTDKYGDGNWPQYVEGQAWYDEINAQCQQYYESNNTGTPDVSLQTGYVVDLHNIDGASDSITEQVALGDTVQVIFKKWGISVKLNVVKLTYNALTGRNESIELNQPKKTLADTIASLIK